MRNDRIQYRQDPLEGTSLVVSIPEEELDQKAFYTLKHTMPPFLIPFSDRTSEGQKVLTYRLEGYSKLRYFYGEKTLEGYIRLWEDLLQPLLDCKDWFLDPLCFLLEEDHLYQNREGTICYLYLPEKTPCSSNEGLRSMMVRLAGNNHISDPRVENIVLGMLVQDFRPEALLEALRRVGMPEQPQAASYSGAPAAAPVSRREVPVPEPVRTQAERPEPPVPAAPSVPAPAGEGEIVIDLSGGGEKPKKQSRFSLFGHKDKGEREDKAAKKEKKAREKKEKEKKTGEKAPLMPPVQAAAPRPQPAAPVYEPPYSARAAAAGSDETQLAEEEGTCLRLVGMAGLPPAIPVDIQAGGFFTIGRRDITVGRQQCSFEFREDTKAVSRRHAVIERDMEGYTITDIGSRAGTRLDGEQLRPNIPYRLRRGARVSFGNGGADYLWEE